MEEPLLAVQIGQTIIITAASTATAGTATATTATATNTSTTITSTVANATTASCSSQGYLVKHLWYRSNSRVNRVVEGGHWWWLYIVIIGDGDGDGRYWWSLTIDWWRGEGNQMVS